MPLSGYTNSSNLCYKSTYYSFTDEELKSYFNNTSWEILFGTNTAYWISSRTLFYDNDYGDLVYSLRSVNENGDLNPKIYLTGSFDQGGDYDGGKSFGLRPVVTVNINNLINK